MVQSAIGVAYVQELQVLASLCSIFVGIEDRTKVSTRLEYESNVYGQCLESLVCNPLHMSLGRTPESRCARKRRYKNETATILIIESSVCYLVRRSYTSHVEVSLILTAGYVLVSTAAALRKPLRGSSKGRTMWVSLSQRAPSHKAVEDGNHVPQDCWGCGGKMIPAAPSMKRP